MARWKDIRFGLVCAAGVMALFGLQQLFPLCKLMMLRNTDSVALKALHSFTCIFVHGNLLHAAVNATAFLCLLFTVKFSDGRAPFFSGLAAGWAATFLFALFIMPQHTTLVGSSGMIFGLLGWFTATEPFSRWSIYFIGSIPLIVLAPAVVLLDSMTAIFFFKLNAWQIHLTAFAIGSGIGCIKWREQVSA